MAKKISASPDESQAHPDQARKSYKITNDLGLHARAAALFVKIASRFKAEVTVRRGKQEVNGKSIMGVLMLAAGRGSEITVATVGEDAPEALQELGQLIENKFGET